MLLIHAATTPGDSLLKDAKGSRSDLLSTVGLGERRRAAAEFSEGVSGAPIHAAIKARLAELDIFGDVLDFGAGTGELTRQLAAIGKYRSITCADLYTRPAGLPPNINWLQVDLNDRLPLPDAGFDLVIGAEVIEHLENPRALGREVFRLLRPGGYVLISTPNNESWRALLALAVRGHFVAFGDTSYPAHITALVRQDLDHALAEAGFIERSFCFTEVGGIPGLPSRTWQSLPGFRGQGLRFSDNLIVTARKASG
jgi:2-polyprenyl-3-methyl-5-hydroxy-6-metoxy-1,4-benzoquinol methylase